jgi:HD-GYP domain-containing protein (c-di-GMP phosphodiesterase class II)
MPWLTAEEAHCLSVRKGTLTPEERSVMESHVSVTARILEHVSFPKAHAQVPRWAGAHPESLHGQGYPRHLQGEEIPWEVRLLTILDVFDALTARDRPYKEPMPVEKALGILRSMVGEGSLDGEVLSLFEKSEAWVEKT